MGYGQQKHPQFEALTKLTTFFDKLPYVASEDEPVRNYYNEYQRKKREMAFKSK